MAFAQEVRDFVSAFTAMSQALGTRSEREQERADKQSLIDYRNSQIAKTKWDMGADARERADIISFSGGDGTEPWGTQPSFSDSSAAGAASGTVSGAAGSGSVSGKISDDDLAAIVQSAHNIGADPRDYIAVMSKESGINPSIWGGKNDDYMGLIQFGADERAQFGANPNQSIPEQLPAVEGYLKARGFKPGMGLAEMYSIINAGSLKNGQPRWGRSDIKGSNIRTHVADIQKRHYPVADQLLQRYTSLSPAGQVAELAGGPATDTLSQGDIGEEIPAGSEDYTVPPGGDVDALTYTDGEVGAGLSSPSIASGAIDPLGVSDPAYRRELVGRPSVMVPGPLPGVVTPAEVPGTEPVSTEPVAGDPSAPGAIPETSAERRAMGFDPLPQTTGYTDPVSASGHDSLSPSSQEAARRVAMGEGDNIPIKGLMRKVLGDARKILGGKEPGVVDDGTDDPVDEAIMSGVGGAPVPLVEAVENAIDPDQKMPDKLRHIRAIQKLYNYYRLSGDEKKATMASFGLYQTYKVMSQKALAMSKEFAQDGDIQEAMQSFIDAYDLVPNGDVMEATPNDDGTFTVTTKDVETGKVLTSQVKSPRDIMSQIMSVTPDEFDALIMRPSVGEAGTSPTTTAAGAISGYEDLPVDGAVPEGGAPGDAEVAAPPPNVPGSGGYAGGDVLTDGEAVPIGSDVISGSSEDTGDGTTEAVPTTPVGAAATGTPAIPEDMQINTHPRKPPSNDAVQAYIKQLIANGDSHTANIVQTRYDRDVAVWENYVKNLQLMQKQAAGQAAGQAASQAYTEFYDALGKAEDSVIFNPDESIYGRIGNATIVNSMRASADAHNAAAKLLNDETLANASTSVLQELTSKYVPTGTYQTTPDQPDSATMVTPNAWYPERGFQTDITGEGAAPGQSVDFPSEDPLVLGLNKADRDTLEQRITAANTAITTQGKAFEPTKPMSIGDMGTVDAALGEALDAARQAIAANTDPKVKANSTAALDIIQNRGHITDVNQAAQELVQLGSHPGSAFNNALAFAMPNMQDMRRTMFTAERVPPENGMPAGMVRVYVRGDDPSTGVIISEGTFRKLDAIRMAVSSELIAKQEDLTRISNRQAVDAQTLEEENRLETDQRQQEMIQENTPENYPLDQGGGGWMQPLPEDR